LLDIHIPARSHCFVSTSFFTQQSYRHYGDVEGATSATCTGPCPAGYFCPVGTIDPVLGKTTDLPTGGVALQCRDTAFHCPEGSATPITTTAGHYSTPNAVTGNFETYEMNELGGV